MDALALHEFHHALGAHFLDLQGKEVVAHYGNPLAEYEALRTSAGVMDLSFRSRLCLMGADRQRFLNGQVTNNVKDLKPGEGCYAALITGKGKMQSDLHVFSLENELLLDFEPGLSGMVSQRIDKYIIADDVQIVDAAPHYALLSVQGPRAGEVVSLLGLPWKLPAQPWQLSQCTNETLGELYLMNLPRTGSHGFFLYVPTAAAGAVADKLITATRSLGGLPCGWQALEMVRIEAGIPRFGQDMDETNLPPETGLEKNAISYTKGCYIGQEVIARIRTYGQVAKALRGLRLPDDLETLPVRGQKLFLNGKDIGYITSALASPALKANIALGYVRREANAIGRELTLSTETGDRTVRVVELPFQATKD